MLLLEDLHWADDATLAVARFLVDHLSATPIGIVATARTVDGRGDVAQLLGPSTQVCELRRLTTAETRDMVIACLGGESDWTFDEVVRDAGGLPLLVEDLLTAGEHSGVPQRFADTVRARLARLDATERSVLSAAAVLGHRFDWSLLPRTVDASQEAVTATLHRAVAFQLVVSDGVGFAFRHALTRDVVLAEMNLIDRQRLCVAAAAVLGSPDVSDQLEVGLMIGRLLAEAGRHEQAAQALLSVGRAALARGMIAAAEPPLRQAALLLDEDQVHGAEARYELARALLLGGHPGAAADVVARAVTLAEARDPDLAARIRLLLVRAAIATADWEGAAASLGRVPRAVDQDAGGAAEVAVLEAQIALGTTPSDVAVAAEHAASRAAGIARDASRADLECEALELLGLCARMRDLDDSVAALERALVRARTANLPSQWLHVLNELGSVEMLRDARADRLEEAHREALRAGALGLAASIGVNLASLYVMTARFADGLEIAQQTEASGARLGLVPLQAAAQLIQGFAMAHQGKGREMERHLRTAESLAPGDAELRSGAWSIGRALFALLQEDRPEARRALIQARFIAPSGHARMLNPYEGPELLLRAVAGDLAVAEARAAADHIVRAARWPKLWTYCALAVALGREGKEEEAKNALTAGLEAGNRYPVFLALAQRIVAEGQIHDTWSQPEPLLRAAEAIFDRFRLGRAANACRRLVASLGSPAPRRRTTDASLHPTLVSAGVTAREAEVMDLLVDRLSNREIAERLYLSPRTVEKHVASLLEKLGVERAALAHVARTLR